MSLLKTVYMLLRAVFSNRARLAAENLALRQQLAVLQRSATVTVDGPSEPSRPAAVCADE